MKFPTMATFKSSARHCCVPGCVSDDRYDQHITFHKIPQNEQLKKQWIIKIRRDEGPLFKITNSTVVCSNHFEKQDYKWTPLRKTLKPGSVPSVFNWTPQNQSTKRRTRKLLAPISGLVQQSANRDVESTETECVMTAQTPEPMEADKTEEVNVMAKDMNWSDTLTYQQSSLRWDIKRTMKSLCKRLADIGEECFVVSVNVNNGWVSHMGSIHGDDFIGENMQIPYNFLDYCRESIEIQAAESKPAEPASENRENDKEEGGDEGPKIAIQIVPNGYSDTETVSSDDEQEKKQGEVLLKPRSVVTKRKSPLKTSPVPVRPKQSPKRKSSDEQKSNDPQLQVNTGGETIRPRPVQGKGKLFNCKQCNHTFKYKGCYNSHLQSESHKLNANKACYKCLSQFDGVADLYRHVKRCRTQASDPFKQLSLPAKDSSQPN